MRNILVRISKKSNIRARISSELQAVEESGGSNGKAMNSPIMKLESSQTYAAAYIYIYIYTNMCLSANM